MSEFNRELAATVLVEAIFTTDAIACGRYDISERTLRNYRSRMVDDPELAALFQTKRLALENAWADKLFPALVEGLDTLADCVRAVRADGEAKKNPQVIAAVAGAVKICAEVQITSRMIDARIGKPDHTASGLSRPGDSQDSAYSN